MKLSLRMLKEYVIRESSGDFDGDAYRNELQRIINKHQGPHTYLRFDQGNGMSVSYAFSPTNPADYDNHRGLWCYMIDGKKEIRDWDFGFGSPHVSIISARQPNKIINTSTYSDADYRRDFMRMANNRELMDGYDEMIARKETEEYDPSEGVSYEVYMKGVQDDLASLKLPFSKIDWAMGVSINLASEIRQELGQEHISHSDSMREFYLTLGYVGIEDPEGLIDTCARAAVFFKSNAIRVIKRYDLSALAQSEQDSDEELLFFSTWQRKALSNRMMLSFNLTS